MRKRFGSKRFRSKKSFRHGSKSTYKKVRSLSKSVKKLQRHEELKNVDTVISTVSIDNSGQGLHTLLNNTSPGTASGGNSTNLIRIGDELQSTSIQFRMEFYNTDTQLVGSHIRHLIFWDRQPNGAVFSSLTDVLDNSVSLDYVYAPYNHNYQQRFKILYDKTMTINPATLKHWTTNSTVPAAVTSMVDEVRETVKFAHYKRKLGRVVKYSGTANDITSIQTNALWSVIITDADVGIIANGNYRWYCKDD